MPTRFTRKSRVISISGHILSRKNGWITAKIYGSAQERGFAHGVLLHKELRKVLHCFSFLVKTDFDTTLDEFVKRSTRIFRPILETKYPEYYNEIVGIHEGAKFKGVDFSIDTLIAWNSYLSMYDEYSSGNPPQRCSAFIATGNATEKGDIVMAHNTHSNFTFALLSNIVLYVLPDKGNSFCMQTCAGLICSSMDWFICSNGLIGCETTISDITYKPIYGVPYYCRIRDCMQYCNTLDEYANTMLHENAGDYACSWLFGDTQTGEIMLCEIGLKRHNIQKTKNGVFYGMNSAIDPVLRSKETNDTEFDDISRSSGARRVRLDYLLHQKYAGKLNITNAKHILSDHYDTFLERTQSGLRSICRHSEIDTETTATQTPFCEVLRTRRNASAFGSGRSTRKLQRTKFDGVYPYGTIDGKVVNTQMAKSMQFVGKYGSSCNRSFHFREYLKTHPEYHSWEKYLVNLPNQPWTTISIKDKPPLSKTRKNTKN
jgi:hypothetical protein